MQTPEGVPLELTLAGFGSRLVAALLDGALQALLLAALAVVLWVGIGLDDELAAGLFLAGLLLVPLAYDVLFEVLANGRTPGKRWTGLRVVRDDGRPITLVPSAVRNLLRILDGPATGYAAGTIAILATRRNQRLGDLAAGTLVLRERTGAAPRAAAPAAVAWPPSEAAAGWDVTGVSGEELSAVRRFLERRHDLAPGPRAALADQLARGLRPRVPGAGEGLGAERFLEELAAAKARRG